MSRPVNLATCSADQCTELVHARGFCKPHYNKNWALEHPERKKKNMQNFILRHGRKRWSHLKRSYDLTKEKFEALYRQQNGLCAICGKPEDETYKGLSRSLSVDHDHITGKIRGLLCSGCNQGLGKFSDNPETLRSAALYLEAHFGNRN